MLNCGPECGGSTCLGFAASGGALIFLVGQQSGLLPTNSALSAACTAYATTCTIPIPGGASNALVDSSTLYVVGQQLMPDNYFGGHLTVVNLTSNTVVPSTSAVPNPVSISDGAPGALSRMLLADDNTLWIGMTKCTNGERANNPGACPMETAA